MPSIIATTVTAVRREPSGWTVLEFEGPLGPGGEVEQGTIRMPISDRQWQVGDVFEIEWLGG